MYVHQEYRKLDVIYSDNLVLILTYVKNASFSNRLALLLSVAFFLVGAFSGGGGIHDRGLERSTPYAPPSSGCMPVHIFFFKDSFMSKSSLLRGSFLAMDL